MFLNGRSSVKHQWEDHFTEVLGNFNDWGVKWWLMYGSLLGAVRNKGLIAGSGDIDIAVCAEDVGKVQDFGSGIAGMCNGKPNYWNYMQGFINIQAYHRLGDRRIFISDNHIIEYGLDNCDIQNLECGRFNKHKVNIPRNAKKYLKLWYGNWKTPQGGVHAQFPVCKITFDHYENPRSADSSAQ